MILSLDTNGDGAITPDEFAAALAQQTTDADVVSWLGDRLRGCDGDLAALNQTLVELSPVSDGAHAFLTRIVKAANPARSDIGTFMALTQLDDEIFLARLRARV